jgi:hypothetical protein
MGNLPVPEVIERLLRLVPAVLPSNNEEGPLGSHLHTNGVFCAGRIPDRKKAPKDITPPEAFISDPSGKPIS